MKLAWFLKISDLPLGLTYRGCHFFADKGRPKVAAEEHGEEECDDDPEAEAFES